MPGAPTSAESSACPPMLPENPARPAPRWAPRTAASEPSQSPNPSGSLSAEERTPCDPPTAMHRLLPPCPACPLCPSARLLTHTHKQLERQEQSSLGLSAGHTLMLSRSRPLNSDLSHSSSHHLAQNTHLFKLSPSLFS